MLWEDARSQLQEEEKGDDQKDKEVLQAHYGKQILVAAHGT